jgi:hypothetical protein
LDQSASSQPWPDKPAQDVPGQRLRARGGQRALVAILSVGLAAYVALFLDTVARSFIRAPYGDGFDILAVEFAAQDRHDPAAYLWLPHNGHHIVWLRLLTSLDVRLFHGQSIVFVLPTLAAVLAAAALIARQIWRGVEDKALASVLATIAPLALLTTLNAFDVSVSINIPYVYAATFAVAAFLAVENATAAIGTVVALLAIAAGAGMGNSVGLAAVPVLMIAVLRRPDRGRLTLFWVLGPILMAVFVLTAGKMSVQAGGQGTAPGAVEQAGRMLRYFLDFCGLPWSATSDRMALPGGLQLAAQVAGLLIGLLLSVLGLFLAARPARGTGARDRLDRFCCSLILFSLAAAAMAVVGRIRATAGMELPVRYSVLLAPLHIGVLVLLAIRSPSLGRASPRTLSTAVSIVLALGLAHQLAGRYVIVRYCGRINHILAEYDAGRRTPEMTQYVYPDLRRAEQVSAEMRRRGVYQ